MPLPADYAKRFLGQTLTIHIDRPLGSTHPKRGYSYPLNYGFIPDTIAPDGAEVDAYLLGVNEPVASHTGQCIAIIQRKDDDDDKCIIVPPGMSLSVAEIKAATYFQEQYFASKVISENTFD